ncbi:hypothetical protein [Zunongwangia pacifica]|uniref:Uncharacterized protein n=1 Tax=Zunongwangia pacifica TaxID=2911062 RepID=A0A9X1ZTK8_9FLAO|nr:hypothetical protein [Zunongwangia pacifica]MCL6218995.1 hypothetical protein [Zunongwangia pacifica]
MGKLNLNKQLTYTIDIKGKTNEKKLAYSNTFLPLFEAIVNSIQAIEEVRMTKTDIIDLSAQTGFI